MGFHKKTSEEKLTEIVKKQKIKVRDLRKLSGKFSSIKTLEEFLHKNKNLDKETEVFNPLYQSGPFIFLSDSKEKKGDYFDLLKEAIQSKLEKDNKKEKVVLILDDRTISLPKENLDLAIQKLQREAKNLPFAAIFVYRGYYSEDDGLFAEFYLSKIK